MSRWHAQRARRLIVGAGDATGGAIARRFAREGYAACVTRRSLDKLQPLVDADRGRRRPAHGFASDARKEEEVVALVEQIEARSAPSRCWCSTSAPTCPRASSTRPRASTSRSGRWPASRGFLNAREVARRMVARGGGTILFTGATASLRGTANFAAFAGAKHALRALAQSMARELGPRGIHVAHVVIDGAIDTEFIRSNFPERYALKEQDGILNPDHIADELLDAARAAARRLDARARPAALVREILMTASTCRVLFRLRQPRRVPGLDPAAAAVRRDRRRDRLEADAAGRRVPGHGQPLAGRGAGQGPRTCWTTCSASRGAMACPSRTTRTFPINTLTADARRHRACRCATPSACAPYVERCSAPCGSRAGT